MKIGIGLPNSVRGATGDVIVEWARRAEARGFSTLGTIGRVAFPAYGELVALAAAAGATERISLMTDILLGPVYNPVLLARDAASLDQLSGGRFVLGASVGARKDDYGITGQDYSTRGRRWDEALELMHQVWRGEPPPGTDQPVGPRPTNGERVPMLIGGNVDAAIRRTARWGAGWTVGGAPPEVVPPFADRVRAAWKEAGREGDPRIVALRYFALGPNAETGAKNGLGDYYAFTGPFAERIVAGAAKTPEAALELARKFEEVGVDELIYFPAIAEVEQVDLLADAVSPG
jgi:alkanesulfonate monooxygenase SsuD/methylene tetrahydromethanopterin reductase-like flavin-dependent oxidoreductase (luciferase family)